MQVFINFATWNLQVVFEPPSRLDCLWVRPPLFKAAQAHLNPTLLEHLVLSRCPCNHLCTQSLHLMRGLTFINPYVAFPTGDPIRAYYITASLVALVLLIAMPRLWAANKHWCWQALSIRTGVFSVIVATGLYLGSSNPALALTTSFSLFAAERSWGAFLCYLAWASLSSWFLWRAYCAHKQRQGQQQHQHQQQQESEGATRNMQQPSEHELGTQHSPFLPHAKEPLSKSAPILHRYVSSSVPAPPSQASQPRKQSAPHKASPPAANIYATLSAQALQGNHMHTPGARHSAHNTANNTRAAGTARAHSSATSGSCAPKPACTALGALTPSRDLSFSFTNASPPVPKPASAMPAASGSCKDSSILPSATMPAASASSDVLPEAAAPPTPNTYNKTCSGLKLPSATSSDLPVGRALSLLKPGSLRSCRGRKGLLYKSDVKYPCCFSIKVQSNPGTYASYADAMSKNLGFAAWTRLQLQSGTKDCVVSTTCVKGCIQLLVFLQTMAVHSSRGPGDLTKSCSTLKAHLLSALPDVGELEGAWFDELQQPERGEEVAGLMPDRASLLCMHPVCLSSITNSDGDSNSGSSFVPPTTLTLQVHAPHAMTVRALMLGPNEMLLVEAEFDLTPGLQDLRMELPCLCLETSALRLVLVATALPHNGEQQQPQQHDQAIMLHSVCSLLVLPEAAARDVQDLWPVMYKAASEEAEESEATGSAETAATVVKPEAEAAPRADTASEPSVTTGTPAAAVTAASVSEEQGAFVKACAWACHFVSFADDMGLLLRPTSGLYSFGFHSAEGRHRLSSRLLSFCEQHGLASVVQVLQTVMLEGAPGPAMSADGCADQAKGEEGVAQGADAAAGGGPGIVPPAGESVVSLTPASSAEGAGQAGAGVRLRAASGEAEMGGGATDKSAGASSESERVASGSDQVPSAEPRGAPVVVGAMEPATETVVGETSNTDAPKKATAAGEASTAAPRARAPALFRRIAGSTSARVTFPKNQAAPTNRQERQRWRKEFLVFAARELYVPRLLLVLAEMASVSWSIDMRAAEHATHCASPLGHIHAPAGLARHPTMNTYPCSGSFLERVLHLGLVPFNPWNAYMFEDWALLAYQLNSYFNFMLMVIAPRLYLTSGVWPWLAALNRLTVLPAFVLQNAWHEKRHSFAPSAFVGLLSGQKDGMYFCIFWCLALSLNWVPSWTEVWLLPPTLVLMFSIFTQCDLSVHNHHMWSAGRVLRALLFVCANQAVIRYGENHLRKGFALRAQRQQELQQRQEQEQLNRDILLQDVTWGSRKKQVD